MVHITDDEVVIRFKHPCPKESISDLQTAITFLLANQDYLTVEREKLRDASQTLLFLLEEMLDVRNDGRE